MNETYLHLYEDGDILQLDREPHNGDLALITAGVLTVVKFEDGRFFELYTNYTWKPFPRIRQV